MTASFERLAAALAEHYRIEREIGSGGMATVYLAQDLKHDRQVAVKVLRPELAATLGPDRFPREIRILAKLQHPHVLPLLDSGESSGFLYYVMPYVEGESLRQKLERDGQMPVHDAVRVLRGPGVRSRARRAASRHQARQRHALGAPRAGDRLRRGQGGERRRR